MRRLILSFSLLNSRCTDLFFVMFQVLLLSSLKHKSTKKKRKPQANNTAKNEKTSAADVLSNNVEKMDIDSDTKMEVEQTA